MPAAPLYKPGDLWLSAKSISLLGAPCGSLQDMAVFVGRGFWWGWWGVWGLYRLEALLTPAHLCVSLPQRKCTGTGNVPWSHSRRMEFREVNQGFGVLIL